MEKKTFKLGLVQKPINAIEVESVLAKVIHSLSMKRTLTGMQNLLKSHMQELTPEDSGKKGKEPIHMQKARDILQHLGIIGEIGSKDILLAVDYIISNPEAAADKKLTDLCAHFCDNPRSAEQRIRRTANAAMSNLAHLGLEDYANDTFVEYSNTLFNFEQVRREMDYIRGRSARGGNVKIRNFLNALAAYCSK